MLLVDWPWCLWAAPWWRAVWVGQTVWACVVAESHMSHCNRPGQHKQNTKREVLHQSWHLTGLISQYHQLLYIIKKYVAGLRTSAWLMSCTFEHSIVSPVQTVWECYLTCTNSMGNVTSRVQTLWECYLTCTNSMTEVLPHLYKRYDRSVPSPVQTVWECYITCTNSMKMLLHMYKQYEMCYLTCTNSMRMLPYLYKQYENVTSHVQKVWDVFPHPFKQYEKCYLTCTNSMRSVTSPKTIWEV